jgi:hypothetical protein
MLPTAQMSLSAIAAAASRNELLTNGLSTTWRPNMLGRWTSVFANTPVAKTITNKNVQIGLNLVLLDSEGMIIGQRQSNPLISLHLL